MPANRCTIHPICPLPRPGKQKETRNHLIVHRPNRKGWKYTRMDFFFSSKPGPHSKGVHLQVFLPPPHCLSHCLWLFVALTLCGILAAILVLGSHLSFGGTRAFLLADGIHRNEQAHSLSSGSLLDTTTAVLKIKNTYRGIWRANGVRIKPPRCLSTTLRVLHRSC